MKLHYNEYGQSGTPLVILHGLFGSSDNWHTLAGKFAQHFHVFCLDLRNHGRSPHDFQLDYETMADDVYEFISDRNLSNIILIGHSMGGKVAMKYAMDFPKSVQQLIIADIAPKIYSPHHQKIIAALESLDLQTIKNRQEAEAHLAQYIPETGVRQFLLKNLIRSESGNFIWRCFLEGIAINYPNILLGIQGRGFVRNTLFIRGEKSNYIQDSDWENIIQMFPSARLETMSNTGHWLHAENPALFYELIIKYTHQG